MLVNTWKASVLLIFFSFNILHFSSGEGEEGGVDCRAVLGAIVKQQLDHAKTCLAEMSFTNGKEKSQKMMCVIVCSMKKAGFLDADGNADAVSSLKFLETLPEELRSRIMSLFMECHEHIAGLKTVEEDPTCKTFEPMMKCAQNMMNKVCV